MIQFLIIVYFYNDYKVKSFIGKKQAFVLIKSGLI